MKYVTILLGASIAAVFGVCQQQDDRPDVPPRDPFLQLFDTDKNGEISESEMNNAGKLLQAMDRNQDGVLTQDELPRPPRHGGDRMQGNGDDRSGPPPRRGNDRMEENEGSRGGPPRRRGNERAEGNGKDRGGPPPRRGRIGDDRRQSTADTSNAARGSVVIQGGYETDRRDGGRPVALIAAALGVEPQVFRDAFSNVKPARNGHPTEAHARANKKVLMDALGKYGITNATLDEVSNYYRYQQANGEHWRSIPAKATTIIENGKVVGLKIINGGSGYTSVPSVRIAGYNDLKVTAEIEFTNNFRTNGRIKSLTIDE